MTAWFDEDPTAMALLAFMSAAEFERSEQGLSSLAATAAMAIAAEFGGGNVLTLSTPPLPQPTREALEKARYLLSCVAAQTPSQSNDRHGENR